MIKLTNILNEGINGDKVVCDKCGWEWNISDGGNDPYTCHKCGTVNEDLRKWFGKGGEGSTTGGGWDRYNTKGEKAGKCGDSEKGDSYAACLSKEKVAKLGKDGIAAFVKRKRAAQSKAGDSKKGGEQKKGQKPTFVKTGASESVNEASKEDIIKDLDKVRNDLIKKVDVLIAKKKKLYSNVDIESPMSADEKKLDKDIQNIFSQIQQIIQQKRTIKEGWSQKYKKSINCSNPKGFSQKAHCAGKKKNESMTIEEKMELFLEKNCPTDPAKWSASKSAAKKKFDVYPSAYANGWAAKNYKSKGGGWKVCKESVIKEVEVGQGHENDRDMVVGVAEILRMVDDVNNRKEIAEAMLRKFKKEGVIHNAEEFLTLSGI